MIRTLGFIGRRTELLGEGALFKNDADYYVKRLHKQKAMQDKHIRELAAELMQQKPFRLLVLSNKLLR